MKFYCLVTEAHRCEQLAQGCYAALWKSNHDLLISSLTPYHCATRLYRVRIKLRLRCEGVPYINGYGTGTPKTYLSSLKPHYIVHFVFVVYCVILMHKCFAKSIQYWRCQRYLTEIDVARAPLKLFPRPQNLLCSIFCLWYILSYWCLVKSYSMPHVPAVVRLLCWCSSTTALQ